MIYNYKVTERKQYPDAIFTQAIKFVARIQLARLVRLYRFTESIDKNILLIACKLIHGNVYLRNNILLRLP